MTEPDGQDGAEIREELSVFGLSDTEIDTYLALLSRGEAPTSTVAEEADVTQRAVYNIAERLEQRGLVRVKDHASPTTVRALPPKEAIGTLSERIEALTPTLEERYNDTTSQAPEIQMVKSRETALKRLRAGISQAKDEALVAIPEHVLPEIEPELRAAVDRDVLVFLLLGEMVDPDENPSRFEGVADAVRYWDEEHPFLYAVDNESAMIGAADVLSGPTADEGAVTVSQNHLTGSVLGIYLSAYWPAGTELHVTDPDPLPMSFDWFRKAVFQAFLHRQRGTDLWADVETRSGESISGPVSQVRQAFVDPSTNEFTLETSLYVETDDGEVSFGGPGAFMETHEADSITLRTDS